MHRTLEFLLHHGYALLLGWVFAEQVGLPVPSMPLLLAACALASAGQISPWPEHRRASPGRDLSHASAAFPALRCLGITSVGRFVPRPGLYIQWSDRTCSGASRISRRLVLGPAPRRPRGLHRA